jgi:hypothetical protein
MALSPEFSKAFLPLSSIAWRHFGIYAPYTLDKSGKNDFLESGIHSPFLVSTIIQVLEND